MTMRFDSVGLGYTAHADGIHVHYPHRALDGTIRYGAGFPIGPYPAEPRNDADRERFAIWAELLASRDLTRSASSAPTASAP